MIQRINFSRGLIRGYFARGISYQTRQNIKIGAKASAVRLITKDDVINFSKLTNDYNPIHTDTENPIVHGALLNGFLSGVLGTKLPGPGTIVIQQQLFYKNPCYAGETVEIIVEVLEVRRIIRCRYKLVANGERIVLEGEGKFILSKIE